MDSDLHDSGQDLYNTLFFLRTNPKCSEMANTFANICSSRRRSAERTTYT